MLDTDAGELFESVAWTIKLCFPTRVGGRTRQPTPGPPVGGGRGGGTGEPELPRLLAAGNGPLLGRCGRLDGLKPWLCGATMSAA
jgi:hypothetical protein